ncbi:hypothetical protein FEM03_18595 [Phragmitibacter flavus]|uniref:Uncharacterized protein n=2 Tax=Phragmitibacter flavus TaxID=2576071 RepID=A0A5R8K9W9_9BACT|nr:hypothetical protein FEM03_18595 [Phragmitibacter flavus]
MRACCQSRIQVRRPASRLGWVGWLVPGVVLALVPKCPACVVGYVALATGIGISLPMAAFLRSVLVGVCLVALGVLLARAMRAKRGRA